MARTIGAVAALADVSVRALHHYDEIGLLSPSGRSAAGYRLYERAELARLQIDRWFYRCSHEMHAMLGEMYVADPRFTATYERIRPGMAAYVRDAIRANAVRAGR
ncbi:MAG: MerR family DNA-binding transcriptional regulator [Actinobacteria bacterium]|nr:MAG: MerR family DNA-binding transcriptional regulator [Actinomycetota bacterium]